MKTEFPGKFIKWAWAALLFTLPFTSFPLLAKVFGGTSVAPLSFIFLGVLFLVGFLPDLFKFRSLPQQILPLILFLCAALISFGLGYFKGIPSFRLVPAWRNAFEGAATLLMGIGFYLVTIFIVRDEAVLRKSLKWINLGALFIFLPSLTQTISWVLLGEYPELLWKIQSLLTSSGLLYQRRVTGVAFEPSWLAHQLNMLYIPLWLGLSIKRHSVYKFRLFGRFTLENLLLAFGLVTLFLSYSRIGWLTTLLILAYIVFRKANELLNLFLSTQSKKTGKQDSWIRHLFLKAGLWLSLIIIFIAVITLLGILLTHLDPRMEKLFDIDRLRQFGVLGWAGQLMFAERLIYWISGFGVFLKYPLFGVGLGGTGYYFPEMTPEFGYKLPEIIRALDFGTFIPNAKNLWVRILAESGVVGFSFFAAWVYTHWKNAMRLERSKENNLTSSMGLVGKLFILALLTEGFSMDTFGLPYLWIAFGLIVAASNIQERGLENSTN